MALCAKNEIILEVEAGVVGGEEDGHDTSGVARRTSSTPPPRTCSACTRPCNGLGGRYMFAATFGNVHGVYKPGNVKLKPTILRDGQDAAQEASTTPASTSSSTAAPAPPRRRFAETLEYGVIKMNIDTDTQYAFTRPIADHMFKNYDGVLKIDGEVGNKKAYDPRSYLKAGEKGMAKRVKEACDDLRSSGKTLFTA